VGVQVVLNVRSGNTRAIACYRSCGFCATSTTLKSLPSGEVVPVLRMQLYIEPIEEIVMSHRRFQRPLVPPT
jgi:ribosomal protein S18 acetylase RimI-like enzyme